MDTFRTLIISRSDEDDSESDDDTPRPLFTDDCEADYSRDDEEDA